LLWITLMNCKISMIQAASNLLISTMCGSYDDDDDDDVSVNEQSSPPAIEVLSRAEELHKLCTVI